jgi:hypothetical protein
VKSNKNLLTARVSKGNKTALHLAVSKGNFEVVKCLIELGSDITAKIGTGETCLELSKNDEIFTFLKLKFQEKIDKQQQIVNKKAQNLTGDSINQLESKLEPNLESSLESNTNQTPLDCDNGSSTAPSAMTDSNTDMVTDHYSASNIFSSSSQEGNISETQSVCPVKDLDIPLATAVLIKNTESGSDSILGVRKIILTGAQRRKKKLACSGGGVKLSHLQDDEEDVE